MLLTAEHITKTFSGNPIFTDISLTIEEKGRYGLIGVNGAGKSTLLQILTGEMDFDEGEVIPAANLTVGYLKQNSGLDIDGTIIGEMRKVFSDVEQAEQRLRELEHTMAEMTDREDRKYRAVVGEYNRLQAYFDSRDGYQTEVKIKTVLNGMGFSDKAAETSVRTLSGGEKTRLAIAKLLLEEPNLLILDEPTNHLDFKTLAWLESYLTEYSGAILTVSHDRYFLDKIVHRVLELERGKLVSYKGNYSAYRLQKQENLLRQQKEYEAQQEEIARMQTYIDKNITRASTSNSAKSRVKALEAMERIEKPESELKQMKLHFSAHREPYKEVLSMENLALAVGEEPKVLAENLNFLLLRHQKVAVIGENGIGKSTLLKTLLGIQEKYAGAYQWGKNTDISYYDQENLNLSRDKSALDELWDRFPHVPEAQIRRALGSVLLTGEDVRKPVSVLSGGERARLALCILMLEQGNVMLLDEPTNHLDIDAKEELKRALKDFKGTILLVSHEPEFYEDWVDNILNIENWTTKIV